MVSVTIRLIKLWTEEGEEPSRISFNITARGEDEGQINLKRENMFFNNADVAKATNGDLAFACDMFDEE